MSSVYAPYLLRLANFSRDAQNGLPIDPAALDAELSQLVAAVDQWGLAIKGITNADGTLAFSQALREMNLIETLSFTGVAGSSLSVVVPAYNPATDLAAVFVNGLLVAPAHIAYTDSTHITVTYPFVGGEVGVIMLSSNGAGALVQLASTAVNLGASLVGIYDTGAIYTSTTVEAALQEVMTKLNTLMTNLGTIANYVLINGSRVMSGNLQLGANKITGLANGTLSTDACTYGQLSAYAGIWNNLSANYLALGGGTMSGILNMGANQITNLADPTAAQDAATQNYVTSQLSVVSTPIGLITPYACITPPGPTETGTTAANWLLCDGSTHSRLLYVTLNSLLSGDGYKFGSGDGSTTFNLPDLRGRNAVGMGTGGLGSTLTPRTIGDNGGEEKHTMLLVEMVAHYHQIKDEASHFGGGSLGGHTQDGTLGSEGAQTGPATDGTNVAAATPFNVMAPWLAVNYIIRAS